MFGGGEPLEKHTEIQNGKEVTVVKLHHQPRKDSSDDLEDIYSVATVAYYYPQYTLKQIYEELPAYYLKPMIKVARAEQAQQLLLLNAIIHGPNQKNKSGYQKLIRKLQEQAKLK